MPSLSTAAASAPTEERVLALVRRHGWNATSFQVLQPGFRYFFDGAEPQGGEPATAGDACVAFVDTGHAWVAAGAPLADPARLHVVADRFVAAARAAGRRACFFGTEQRFAEAVAAVTDPTSPASSPPSSPSSSPLRSLLVGEQAIWEPAAWAETVAATRGLRSQLRRARAKGVRVRATTAAELTAPASPARAAALALVERWLGTRELAPMGFLVHLDPLSLRDDHRLYLAETGDGRLVGLLAASPIFARRGWLLEALVRAPDAPNGTAELLVDEAMRVAAAGDDALVTLGLAPLAGEVARPLRWARAAGAVLFDFEGLRAFKAKLRPQRWDPVYLTYPAAQGAVWSIRDVLAAFARGRLLRFGVETLLRGPTLVVWALALALVPWTAALALAAPARWFPHAALRWGWVVFDALLAAGLVSLAGRWRPRLATALAAAVGLDALATTAEVALWNLPRVRTPVDAVVAAAAVLAPALAFAVLRRARARRLRARAPAISRWAHRDSNPGPED